MLKQSFIAGCFLAFIAIPTPTLAQVPAVTSGLTWLNSTQTVEGAWPGVETLDLVATSSAADALFLLDPTSPGYATSLQWLGSQPASPTDLLARRIIAMAREGRDTSDEISALLTLRDSTTGAWGDDSGFGDTILDAALALQALKAAGFAESGILYPAVQFLTRNQYPGGGWGVYPGAVTNTYVSALVLQTLAQFQTTYPVQVNLDKGLAYLLTKQNPDGGFGSSPSTIHETALAVQAIVSAGELDAGRIQAGMAALGYVGEKQLTNGSWQDDAFSTALALKALAHAKPDLALRTGDIRVSTTSPLEGETVTLTATVRNLGLEPVAMALVRLLDGDSMVAEQTVAALAPGEATEVAFTIDALAPAGEHNLRVLLDPEGSLAELREENNAGSFRLWAATRPDLILLPEFFTFTPASPRPGEPVTLTIWIANLGETPVAQASADLYDGDPAAGGAKLGSLTLYNLSAGGWGEGSITFTLDAEGEHTLTLMADPENAIPEQDETNNSAVRSLTVAAATAGPADLLIPVDGLRLDPARPRSGEAVTITVQALNLGAEAVSTDLELFDGDPLSGGILLRREEVTLSPGETRSVQVPWQADGIHTLYAFVDRANLIAEFDETNNRSELPLMFDMVDLEVSANDLATLPGQPMAGDAATVSVTVRNRGIAPTGPFDVVLYDGDPDSGGTLLETFAVADLAGDGAETLTHDFTAERGDHRFFIVCDPGGQVTELFEGNNAAIRSLSVKTSEEALGPDLVPIELDLTGTMQNPQSLRIEGTALVKVQNQGDDKVVDPYRVVVFEDRDGDGLYSEGKDQTLGSWDYPLPMWPNGVALAPVPVSGTLTFRDAPIYAVVDTEQAVFEQSEENNTLRRGSYCEARPADPIEPVVEWTWRSGKHICFDQITAPPKIANFTDDNGDGKIDQNDTPDVLFITPDDGSCGGGAHGGIHLVDGKTGEEIFYIPQNPAKRIFALANMAVGDIDNDGLPEFVVPGRSQFGGKRLEAYNHDGTLLWDNANMIAEWRATQTGPSDVTLGDESVPTIADLDADGTLEIIVGPTIFNSDGSVRSGVVYDADYYSGGKDVGTIFGGIMNYSQVADLDMDGRSEIVAGNTVYNSDGSVKWTNFNVLRGINAIGNFDDDKYPEIVLVSNVYNAKYPRGCKIYLLEHDGSLKWGPIYLRDFEASPQGYETWEGSPAVIADFDGDGKADIGVRGSDKFFILDRSGHFKASLDIGIATIQKAPTAFDLDGDGSCEILSNNGKYFRIFSGKDGRQLYEEEFGAMGTYFQSVIVADVDADDQAEIVVFGGHGGWTPSSWSPQAGIKVFGAKENNWVNTSKIWNQAGYHVTNVNDDGTIPRHEAPSWLLNNSYLVNEPVGGRAADNPYLSPDLSASYVRVDMAGYPASASVTVRIGNGGSSAAAAGVPVALYDADPQAGGVLIGTATTSRNLLPSEYEDVTLEWSAPAEGSHTLFIRADSDGSVEECDEANNETALDIVLTGGGSVSAGLPDLSVAPEAMTLPPDMPEGSLVAVGLTVRNLGAEAAENAVLRLFVGDPARGGRQVGDDRTIAPLGAGEATTVTIFWNTLGYLGLNYLYAVVDPDEQIAEANEGNNTALRAVVVGAALKPDLQIEAGGISIAPAAPAEGDLLTITATLHNRGTAVGDVKAVLYDGDPAAGGDALGEAVISQSIPFGGSASVTISLATIGLSGSRTLLVVLDPDNRIDEADEGNNQAFLEIVIAPARLNLGLTADKTAFGANESVLVTLRVAEQGATGRSLTYDLRVEDRAGRTVATVALNKPLHVGANAVVEIAVPWDTGATLSGEYLLAAALKEGGKEVARATAPFAILPEKAVKVSVATDKAAYGANETVALVAAVASDSPNYLFAGLTARLSVLDPQGVEVFSASRTVPLLTHGQSTPVTAYWNINNAPRGAYTVRLDLSEGETPLGQAQALFEVLGSADTGAGVGGAITVEPTVIEYGEKGRLLFTVRNQGNEALTGQALTLLLVDPDTKEAARTIALGAQENLVAGGSATGTAVLETDGLALKNYLVLLQVESGALRKSLAGAAFRVKDETPPTLGVLSPPAAAIYRTGVPVTVQAADAASGIDRVEYRLDAREDWTALSPSDPASGVYAALWEPTLADDGEHTLVVRAIDRAGNETVSPAVAFKVQMDSDPPVTQLDIGEPAFHTSAGATFVTRATAFSLAAGDDLSGVQGTWYRFDDDPQWRLYNGTFRLDDLGFGAHVLRFQSVDNAGNAEEEQTAAVGLIDVEVATEMLHLPRVLVWTGDPDRIGSKDRPPYTLKDVRALVAEALSEPDAYVTVVTDKDAFQGAFRSSLFNVVMILEQDTPFDANFLREMREAVYGGIGLLVSSWKNNVHPILQALFGVDFRGAMAMNEEGRSLRLFESPLAADQTLAVQGRVLRTNLAGGLLAGIIPGESNCSGVHSLTLHYPVAVRPDDRLTATLTAPQGKRLVTADEEQTMVGAASGGAVNGSLGNTAGDLALTGITTEGLDLVITSPYGELAANYTLTLTVERADGSRIVAGPATITPTCDAHLTAGMMLGPFEVTQVGEDRSNVSADLPAVVLGSYGAGRTGFLAYDLVGSALTGSRDGHSALLRNAATWLLPEETGARPGGIILLQTRLLPKGAEADLKAVDTLGEGLQYLPVFGLTLQPLEYTFHLGDREEGSYRYFLRIPETEAEYGKTTDVSLGLDGGYVPFNSHPFRITVEADWQAQPE